MFALLRKPDADRRDVLLLSPSAWSFAALLLGLAVIFLAVALDGDVHEDRAMVLRSLLLASAFGVTGTLCALLVQGWTFDRKRGRATSWWSLVGATRFRFLAREHEVDDFDRVTVDHETHQARQKVTHAYPLRLDAAPLEAGILEERDALEDEQRGRRALPLPLSIAVFSAGDRAWRLGRELAEFLGLDLDDTTLGPRLHREAAELGLPLAERTSVSPAPAEPPTGGRLRIERRDGAMRAVLPPGGLRAQHSLAVLVGAALTAFLVFVVNPSGDAPAQGASAMAWYLFVNLAVELLPLGLTVIRAALAENRLHVIVAHPERGLLVTSRFLGFSRSRPMPWNELEDVEVLPAGEDNPARGRLFPHDPALLLRSREETRILGHGLSYPELEWLRHEILHTVVPEPEGGED